MKIFDLNHIEAVEGTEVLGGGRGSRGGTRYSFKKDIDIDVDVDFDIDKNVDSKVNVKGNLGDAEAYADAKGDNSYAETLTDSGATTKSSFGYSSSVSAVN